MTLAELEAVVRRSMTGVITASGLPPNGNTAAMNDATAAIMQAARQYAATDRQRRRASPAPEPAADVHYLTRHLRIPCIEDLKDLEAAPLNTVFRDKVTCPECKASPEYAAGLTVSRQP